VDEPVRRAVPEAEAKHFANSLNINYFETSAKENLNVEQVNQFHHLFSPSISIDEFTVSGY